jgi:hypothetical protein
MNVMKKKKSRIELAREIIANLRRGMNRQPAQPTAQNNLHVEPTPFMPAPMPRPARNNRPLHASPLHF